MTITSNQNPVLDALHGWVRLWNGDYDVARTILTPECAIRFGGTAIGALADHLHGPDAIARLIADFREPRPDLVYSEVDLFVADTHATMIWNADRAERHTGGIDVFEFDDHGRIAAVRSVSAERGWTS